MIERSNRHRETPRQQKKSDGDTGALEKKLFLLFLINKITGFQKSWFMCLETFKCFLFI